jgi:hypothetical protein
MAECPDHGGMGSLVDGVAISKGIKNPGMTNMPGSIE